MTALASASRRSPLHQQIKSAAFGLLATATFLSAGTSAFAGTKEIAAVSAKLPTGVSLQTATSAQLATAVVAAINDTANAKLNPGVIAGEALKGAGSNALDAGAKIASAIVTAFPTTVPFGAKPQTYEVFATNAIKTTAAGTGATVLQVPGFSAGLVATDATAISLAVQVKSTKLAAGAVLQGRASELASDALKQALANDALDDKGLSAVVQDVAKGVASQVQDAAAFTNAVITPLANSKNLLKIIPGVAAGKPTEAGAVTKAAFANATYAPLGSGSPIVKGAAALAKSIGAVADIEQIQKVGAAIAGQIAVTTTIKGKVVPNIKLSAATGIASTLAKAIAAKPFATIGANRNDNKSDELGELAAYFISALSASAEFNATKVVKGATVAATADKTVTALLKAVVAGGKIAKGKGTASPNAQEIAAYTAKLAVYVAGSVAVTVDNLPAGPIKDSIKLALNASTFAKSVAGVSNEGAVRAAITAGLSGVPAQTKPFENGFLAVNGLGAALTDPETNFRDL